MNFKKRYFAFALSLFAYGGCQYGFLQFRTSEPEQIEKLEKSGQPNASFYKYEVNGRQMHYSHVGPDSLPLLIMVHGSPGSSDNMLDFLSDERLLEKYQVAAVDRPGFGDSDFGKAQRSITRQAEAIQPIMERHGNGKAILLGHSFGGPVIARMAIDFSEQVSGLVIVSGSIDPELEPKKWIQKPADWRIFRWMLPPAIRVCNQEILALPAELEAMKPEWKQITCPVTVVQGMADKLVHPGNADFAHRILTSSERVKLDTLEGQNHFVLWSHHDRIVDHLIELLEYSDQ